MTEIQNVNNVNDVENETMNIKEKTIMQKNTSTSTDKKTIFLALTAVKQRDDFRCRVQENEETIEKYTALSSEYKEAKDMGECVTYPFPPVKVWFDNGKYVLLGGYHRLEAAHNAGLDAIQASVFYGSEDDAFMIALKDNSTHGLPPTRGDLRLCIEKAVARFPQKTPAVIAEMLGCSRSYVSEIKRQLSASGIVEIPEKQIGKDGKEYPTTRERTTRQSTDGSEKTSNSTLDNSIDDMLDKVPEQVDDEGATADEVISDGAATPFDFGKDRTPEKLSEEQMEDIFDRIDNFLNGKSMKDGKNFLRELFTRYGRVNNYFKEQALRNSNNAIIVMDQFVKAT